jgi:NADH dehydrogenase
MRILVAGGTGRLGSRLANELSRQGHQVRVLSRGLTPTACDLDPAVEVVRGDVRDPRTLTDPMRDVDLVVSAVQGFQGPGGVSPASVDRDGNLHLIAAAENAGASFVMLSVIGAAADSRVEIFRMKYAAEQHLRASRCRWTIVRADAYAETWREVMEQTAGSSHRPLVFGNGRTPVSFVSIEDVVPLVVQAVLDPDLRGRVLEICGPQAVSMSELAGMVMEMHAWSGRPRRIPRPVLHLVAGTVGVVKPAIRRQVKAALALDGLPTRTDHSLRHEFPGLTRTAVSAVIAGP